MLKKQQYKEEIFGYSKILSYLCCQIREIYKKGGQNKQVI